MKIVISLGPKGKSKNPIVALVKNIERRNNLLTKLKKVNNEDQALEIFKELVDNTNKEEVLMNRSFGLEHKYVLN